LAESIAMSDAYAAAGVDTSQADDAVDALVSVLRTIELDRPSASVLPSGHYASVLRVAPNLGIAVSTDGVGSKIVVAEQADRLETVGIDCVAMNVNDLICVAPSRSRCSTTSPSSRPIPMRSRASAWA
jgi:phosphoribosylformylglycinamidine cyclo-ligase